MSFERMYHRGRWLPYSKEWTCCHSDSRYGSGCTPITDQEQHGADYQEEEEKRQPLRSVSKSMFANANCGLSHNSTPEFSHLSSKRPNMNWVVQAVTWCDTSMAGFLRLWPNARHDFLLLHIGRSKSERVPKWFTKDRIVETHHYAVMDFSGLYSEINRSHPFGVVSCFELLVEANVARDRMDQVQGKLMEKIGKNCKTYQTLDIAAKQLTITDLLLLASKFAYGGYDLFSMNCRTFAGSMYISLKEGRMIVREDTENRLSRGMASKYFPQLSASSSASRSSASSATAAFNTVLATANWTNIAEAVHGVVEYFRDIRKVRRL